MKHLWLFLIVLMLSGTAQATYFNDSVIHLGNTSAWITLNQFTFDNFTNYNETDNPANTLQFYINGSQIRFTSNVNKTLTNPSFNNVTDNLTFQLSGSSGWLNFSTTMLNASNSYNLSANGAFVESRNTTASKLVWFNYTGDATLSVTWNASVPSSPPPAVNGSPTITSYSPASLTPTIDVNALTTFNSGANQSVQWTWTGATEGIGDGTTNSTATQTWTTIGAKTVTVTCSNANGSCGTIQWNVNVVSDGGGGGTNWDYLTGTVTPSGSTITINPSVTGSPTTGGAYTFGYVFVDGQTYWVNVSKAGYEPNNTQITFTLDHTTWNPILTPLSASLIVITNAATSLTTDGAQLNGEINSSAFPAVAYFEYSASPSSYKYKTPNQNIASNGTFTATLKGMPLISNTNYYYRAVANDSTTSAYGNQVNFMTSAIGIIPSYGFDKNFNNLTNANFDPVNMTSVASSPFTNVVGNIFWGFIFAIIFIMLWLRMEDVTIPALVGLIIGGSIWVMMPGEWTQMAASLTVVSFAGLVYSLIKGRS